MNKFSIQESELYPAHVLIVDDDRSLGAMLVNFISKCTGFECFYCDSVREALQVLEERVFDVVITDIKMPDMTGLELTRIIKEKYDSDVIVITGFYEDFTYEQAIEDGANDFIEKPVRPTELIIRLKRILRERAIMYKRQRAEEDREDSLRSLRKALGATVQALAATAEIRDPYTAGHQRRVADLARSIAVKIGLRYDQIDGIRTAGTIHDIGKISVPAEILSKPTKLSGIEFSLIKVHPQSGHDILKDIDFPWPVARMVLEHHEKINGSGYPHGLRENDILLESRIIVVADVVEAIASHRPYRPALGIDMALSEIAKDRGILYDKDAVDACLTIFRDDGYQLPN